MRCPRSTTTCVIGTAKRSRACSTTPRSSQCERPSGCVEMIDLVGPERPQRVLDRLQRIGVADLARAPRCPPRAASPGSRRAARCAALRAGSSSDARCWSGDGCAGATTSTFVAVALALALDHRVQRLAGDGLVRDDEDPPLVVGMRERRRDARRRLVATAQERDVDGGEREHDEDRDAEPRVDHRADRRSARSSRSSAAGTGRPRPRCGTDSSRSLLIDLL